MIKIPGQQETLQFNKYNDWLQVCIPGHELIAFVFIFTILIINFTLEAGNSFVKEISLISIGGLFELRRVTPPPTTCLWLNLDGQLKIVLEIKSSELGFGKLITGAEWRRSPGRGRPKGRRDRNPS